MYHEADEVIHTMKADARQNCGNLQDETSVTCPTPSTGSSREKLQIQYLRAKV